MHSPREIGPTYRARRPADHRPNKKKKKREREKGGRRESFRSLLEEEIFSFFFLLEITGVVCLNGRTNLVLQTIRDRPSSSLPTLPPPPSRSVSCKFHEGSVSFLSGDSRSFSEELLSWRGEKICHPVLAYLSSIIVVAKIAFDGKGREEVCRGLLVASIERKKKKKKEKEEEEVSKSPIIKTCPSKKKLLISKVRTTRRQELQELT